MSCLFITSRHLAWKQRPGPKNILQGLNLGQLSPPPPEKPIKNAHYHTIFLAWKKILWQRKNNTRRKGSKKTAFAVYLWKGLTPPAAPLPASVSQLNITKHTHPPLFVSIRKGVSAAWNIFMRSLLFHIEPFRQKTTKSAQNNNLLYLQHYYNTVTIQYSSAHHLLTLWI